MSRGVNKAVLIGNLAADPELRTTASGTRVATFKLATSRRQGAAAAQTDWHRVVAWDRVAELVERSSARKGDRVFVEGPLEYRTWQDAAGRTRQVTEINAHEVIVLSERTGVPVWRPEPEPEAVRRRYAAGDDLPF
jgi:single-strand DNA-binding protein